MTVEYDVTHDDLTQFIRHVLRTHPQFRRTYLWGFLAGPLIGVLFLLAIGHTGFVSSAVKLLGATLLFTGLYVHFSRKQVSQNVRRAYSAEGGPIGRKALTVSAEGIEESGEHATSRHKWSGIQAIQETPQAVYLYYSPGAAYIVPRRAFSTPAEAARFLAEVRALHSESSHA
jgi:Zn-dependent protease with chaperone function